MPRSDMIFHRQLLRLATWCGCFARPRFVYHGLQWCWAEVKPLTEHL